MWMRPIIFEYWLIRYRIRFFSLFLYDRLIHFWGQLPSFLFLIYPIFHVIFRTPTHTANPQSPRRRGIYESYTHTIKIYPRYPLMIWSPRLCSDRYMKDSSIRPPDHPTPCERTRKTSRNSSLRRHQRWKKTICLQTAYSMSRPHSDSRTRESD